MSEKTYRINEIFYSLQGEGVRQGTANVFVRFSGCNLKCAIDDPDSGFDCDTEFTSGEVLTATQILEIVNAEGGDCDWVILTGGEPSLQINQPLIDLFHEQGYSVAIETNGTRELPSGIDWICVSPKSAEHTLRINRNVDEVKYVRRVGQSIPKSGLQAHHQLISPAFEPDGTLKRETLDWCIKLVETNPHWRLSVQLHKFFKVR